MSNEPLYFTLKLVEEYLGMHDFHCVFELDAPINIFNRLQAAGFYTSYDMRDPSRPDDGRFTQRDLDRCNEFRKCWQLSEIYCPDEGIDRRSEYGMTDLLKA